jgi:nitrogen fixation/metabolism regulation signal transduction histidine kinase
MSLGNPRIKVDGANIGGGLAKPDESRIQEGYISMDEKGYGVSLNTNEN